MRISDIIEEFIKEMFEEENEIEIQRNYLAEKFNCVPSQINYVIATRFKPVQGYTVESSRGGGGHITIRKLDIEKSSFLLHIIENIGNRMSAHDVSIFITNFLKEGIINTKEAKLIKAATSDNVLSNIEYKKRDEIRSDIFKNMIVNIVED